MLKVWQSFIVVQVLLLCHVAAVAGTSATPPRCDEFENGYRLANGSFEADISYGGPTIGVTRLGAPGGAHREEIHATEVPISLRLATDAPRIDILNWSFHAGSGTAVPPEQECGYQLGLHKATVDNNGGPRVQRLNETLLGPPFYTDVFYPGYVWYRRMIDLPKEWEGQPVVFVLGGSDEYDWRNYWVYLNGERIGQSSFDDTYAGPWHEAPRYVLKPGNAGYSKLKFGQPNLLAVQARNLDRRTPEMPRLDLERFSGQSLLVDQYVSRGEPTEDVAGFDFVRPQTSTVNDIATVQLEFKHPTRDLVITAKYWVNSTDAVLHKQVLVRNTGSKPVTLLEADVLDLKIEKSAITGGGQGWPCRIGNDWFAGVEHPAGVARYGPEGLRLQVSPGAVLDVAHDNEYASKTAVVGVGNGRRAFSDYLSAHCRRKPQFLNMYSLYGLCEIASGIYPHVELTEEMVLKSVDQLRDLQQRGIRFDYYCIDTGWNDPAGDLKTFHPTNFPHGEKKALAAVHELGMKPLLWMSPAAGPAVFRGGVQNRVLDPGGKDNSGKWGYYCLAAEPWRSTLRDAMLHQVNENGVRGFKLDEVTFFCGRSEHGHLPNKYGIEAEMDAFIGTLDTVREQCPDVLYMLYWRFMSPWWLLHADTIYDREMLMEGSTPSDLPSRITRQSVTVALDQGHDWNWDTMPLIGQDSLGVWLSNTRWGSWMGAEGWREAWIMDFARGNMMNQLWGDLSLLDASDLEFMESISRWTAKNSELLRHPRRILGGPWQRGAYGYVCCDGDHGVIVVNNANFAADVVHVPLDASIGLSAYDPQQLYEVRWIYKDGSTREQPTQIVKAGDSLQIELGSFEVCMADVSPAAAGAKVSRTNDAPAYKTQEPQKIPARFEQTELRPLSWYDPEAQQSLAKVVNGRTRSTLTPGVLAAGPDQSDERDRDAVQENLQSTISLPPLKAASKLIVVTSFQRDGIAWHHLAPFEIVHVTAQAGEKQLTGKLTPRRMHEEAGAWSWVVYEFDVPAECKQVDLKVDACHPKSVALDFEVWQAER